MYDSSFLEEERLATKVAIANIGQNLKGKVRVACAVCCNSANFDELQLSSKSSCQKSWQKRIEVFY